MDEYKSNSNILKDRPQEEPKKVAKVVSGKVRLKKRTGLQKVLDVLVADDVRSVPGMLFTDVVLPAIIKLIDDAVTNGIHMVLYGRMNKSNGSTNAARVSYSSYYNGGQPQKREESSNGHYAYDSLEFDSRKDAEDVLTGMMGILEKYGTVSVNDLYDLVGIDGDYTETKYGWRDLKTADVVRGRNAYQLKLPRAIPLG